MSTESPTAPEQETRPPRYRPIGLRSPEQRFAHIVQRLQERGGITWTIEQVANLEKKIRWTRSKTYSNQTVPAIFPKELCAGRDDTTRHYAVFINSVRHTFIWSRPCRGLISYIGQGEITAPLLPKEESNG